jgi:hypothetical protein
MLFTVFGAAFGMQLYVVIAHDTRKDRVLKYDDRAFDTGSERIWNGINKGVCENLAIQTSVANALDSVNGRTSSRSIWSQPRKTSRAAASRHSKHDMRTSHGTRRRTLYIRMYSTAAKYQDKILIIKTHIPFDPGCDG